MRGTVFRGISILLLMLVTWGVVSALTVEEIADRFKKKYEEMKNFSADFEETSFIAGRKRVAKGKVSFQKPNLLRQEYFDPANPKNVTQLNISDGQILWSYVPQINQVTKTKLSQDESRMELLPGFGRSLEKIEQNYSLSLVEDEAAKKKGIHLVELIPRSRDVNSMFDVLRVWIRDEDSVLVQFMYRDKKNETTYILSFKDIKINENLDESTFSFQVPEGVQVITVPDN